eukprot:scaffold12150_cov21-Cyclotella_meneghiniana.AAC.1
MAKGNSLIDGLLIVKKSSACMPVDWQSSPKHHACLSTPVVDRREMRRLPACRLRLSVIYSEKTERGTRLPAYDCLLILTVSRLPAYDCSHRREMRRLPACRLRLSRRLASPGWDNRGCLPVVKKSAACLTVTCQSYSRLLHSLPTPANHSRLIFQDWRLQQRLKLNSCQSCLESETTDWQAPASCTVCPTPAWPRLYAQAQNEATLQLAPAGDWHTTDNP